MVAVDNRRNKFDSIFSISREEVPKELIVLFREELEMEKHATSTLSLFFIEKILLGFGAKFCFDVARFVISQVPPLGTLNEMIWMINNIETAN